MTFKTFVLPAGFYFIGDPCFAVNNGNLWSEFLGESTFPRSSDCFEENKATARGFTIWAGNTMYGDGEYFDNEGYIYGVDSGLIGIVNMEDVKKMADEETLEELKKIFENDEESFLGRVVKFEKEFTVTFNSEDPTHSFGHLEINTGNEEDYLDESYLDNDYDVEYEAADDE